VALNKKSGVEVWRALENSASYSAPIIIRQAGRQVLVCWTGGHAAGLDIEGGGRIAFFLFEALARGGRSVQR
jgi:glucose dehydrogenase